MKPKRSQPRKLEDNGLLERIGHLIETARRERHWTQEQLGAKLGRTKMTIIRWEAARSDPGVAGLVELARLFEECVLFAPVQQALNALRPELSLEVTKSVIDASLEAQG